MIKYRVHVAQRDPSSQTNEVRVFEFQTRRQAKGFRQDILEKRSPGSAVSDVQPVELAVRPVARKRKAASA